MDKEKTKQLILYITNELEGVSEAKLNLLLYYIDFIYYREHEETITGLDYRKAPRDFWDWKPEKREEWVKNQTNQS